MFLRNHVGKNSKQEIQVAWSTLIHHVKWWISYFRGAYRTHTTSEMELFVILVCGFQQIYVTESLVLVLVGILDVPLHFIIISIIYYHFYIIICYYFTPPENHQPCSGGGACVIQQPWELCWQKLQLLAGLTKPGRSKGRMQTNRWSNRWQQGEGSVHRQIQPGVLWLRVTVVLGRKLWLLQGAPSINSQISNRKKIFRRDSTSEWVS